MKKFIMAALVALPVVLVPASASAVAATYFQGFEVDTAGWVDFGAGTVVRTPSGYTNGGGYADGILSSSGDWHARLKVDHALCQVDQAGGGPVNQCTGPFTRWGGYNTTWTGGYTTQLDIYLDTAYAAAHPDSYGGTDSRFDWVSAINNASGTHLRDFAFNGGTGPNPNALNICAAGGFWIAASTNSTRSGATPYNSDKDPKCIATSGWYTFKHTFRDDGGVLAVDFDILDAATGLSATCLDTTGAAVPCHWTITTTDAITGVGCNRYGFFSNQEINDLAIDNTRMAGCGIPLAPPSITVTKSADPTSRPAPGGDFTFSVTVTNDSTGTVTLTSLTDDVYGNLNGQGTCVTGGTIAASATYSCSFTGSFTGVAGDSQTDTVTAKVTDASGTEGTGSDSATVTITAVPAPTGVLEICKKADNSNGPVTGSYTFTFADRSVTVPVGTCTGPLTVPAGDLTVHEVAKTGIRISACATRPIDRLAKCDPANSLAIVRIVAGGVQKETILTITNKVKTDSNTGAIKVCKIAGTGVTVGTNFTFTVGAKTVTVPAGPAGQGGYCKIVSGFTRGTNVTVTEAAKTGTHVSAIKVQPLDRQVSKSTANRTATVKVASTVTVVTFTNAANTA